MIEKYKFTLAIQHKKENQGNTKVKNLFMYSIRLQVHMRTL